MPLYIIYYEIARSECKSVSKVEQSVKLTPDEYNNANMVSDQMTGTSL